VKDMAVDVNMLAIFCFAFGFILMVIEIFHPGFGIFGIFGGILLILGIVLMAKTIMEALVMFIVILALLGLMLAIAIQSASKGRLSKILILHSEQRKESGYIGTEDLNYFLDSEGEALTILRPAGTADFKGVKLDVVTEGDFISKGEKVKVIKVQGRRIVVRKI
jgi:membrane-bound ClpP family serine protease